MTAHSHQMGHLLVWKNNEWLYADTGQPASVSRPCPECGKPQTVEGHDPCLGTLPGVSNACCGHGGRCESYLQFSEGEEEII